MTDVACKGLNGLELGEKKLIVQRASVNASKSGGAGQNANAAPHIEPTRVVMLLNMVTEADLIDDEDYQGI